MMYADGSDRLSSQIMMQSLIFTYLVLTQRRRAMKELLRGHEGVAGVTTAFVAFVTLEKDPRASQVLVSQSLEHK